MKAFLATLLLLLTARNGSCGCIAVLWQVAGRTVLVIGPQHKILKHDSKATRGSKTGKIWHGRKKKTGSEGHEKEEQRRRRRKNGGFPVPAAWRRRLRIIRSKDEATPFTACCWGFYFLVETRLPRGLLKKKSLDGSPRLDKYSLGRHVHEDEKERAGSKRRRRRRNGSHQGSTPEARGGVEPPTVRFGIERATPCATGLGTCRHSPS